MRFYSIDDFPEAIISTEQKDNSYKLNDTYKMKVPGQKDKDVVITGFGNGVYLKIDEDIVYYPAEVAKNILFKPVENPVVDPLIETEFFPGFIKQITNINHQMEALVAEAKAFQEKHKINI